MFSAFDRMNHYALLIKLMDRRLPNEILNILELWFNISVTCVKWNGSMSHFFRLYSLVFVRVECCLRFYLLCLLAVLYIRLKLLVLPTVLVVICLPYVLTFFFMQIADDILLIVDHSECQFFKALNAIFLAKLGGSHRKRLF